MMIRVDDFIRSEKAYRTTELPKGEKIDNYRKEYHPNSYNSRNDQFTSRAPNRGDRRRNNHREEYKPRRNDHYAPYIPAKNDNAYRTDYRRNDNYLRDTRPIDLN